MDSKNAPLVMKFGLALAATVAAALCWAPNPTNSRSNRLERAAEIRSGSRPAVVTQFEREKRRVALTFDDGPQPQTTRGVLQVLKQFNVKATFFMIGAKVDVEPEIAREVAAAGHEIGNHTMMHRNLTTMSPSQVAQEFQSTSSILESKLGISPELCRPPGGNYNQDVINAATDEGMTTVLWTTNPGDCNFDSAATIAKHVLDSVKPGGIILLHDTVPATVDALPIILKGLKKRGLLAVPVSTMIRSNSR